MQKHTDKSCGRRKLRPVLFDEVFVNPPNIISFFRIVTAVVMAFSHYGGALFVAMYILGGISDMLDGYIARKLCCCTAFGEKLDSLADFIFVMAAIFAFATNVFIPVWVWISAAVIAIIKLISLVISIKKQQKFIPMHDKFNKAAGLICFMLPLGCVIIDSKLSFIIACAVAFAAAVDELIKTIK